MTVPAGGSKIVPFPNVSADDPNPREIVVIKPSSLGDVVHTLPAVALIKRRWPEARLRWLINPEWAPLLEGNPDVDEIVIFPRGELRGAQGLLRIPAWASRLSTNVQADLVLDFQGLLRSALIAKLCRAKAGRIVGLSDAREGATLFYSHAADVAGIDHAVDRYLALVRALRIDTSTPLQWTLPEGTAPAGFSGEGRFVVLHPFSRGKGKSLSVDDVMRFCRELPDCQIVLAGRADEPVPAAPNVINLLNQTSLPELIWVLRRAAFVVSVDSGPMHIAAALTPRLLSIHTWSDPKKVGPYRDEAWVWKDGVVYQMQDLDRVAGHRPAADITAVARHVAEMIGKAS